MVILENPRKKATNYVSKITDDNGKIIKVKIPYSKYVYLHEQQAGGHLLRILLEDNSKPLLKIKDIDENVRMNAVDNNTKWFHNSLSENEIESYFRKSIQDHNNVITVMIPDIHDIIIRYNNEVIEKLSTDKFQDPNIYLSLEIEAQGLYFFPKRFGIRWIVNKLSIHNEFQNESSFDEFIDKENIENEWTEDIQHIEVMINKDIEILEKKTLQLDQLKKNLYETLENAKNIKNVSKEWHIKLKELSHRITKYYES
jgi:hypothetical protein